MALYKKFSKDNKTCTVEFYVSPEAAQGVSSIAVAGEFNNWAEQKDMLKKATDGSFSGTVKMDADREYQFRYLYDGFKWENDWAADGYVPNSYATTDNSVVKTYSKKKH